MFTINLILALLSSMAIVNMFISELMKYNNLDFYYIKETSDEIKINYVIHEIVEIDENNFERIFIQTKD